MFWPAFVSLKDTQGHILPTELYRTAVRYTSTLSGRVNPPPPPLADSFNSTMLFEDPNDLRASHYLRLAKCGSPLIIPLIDRLLGSIA
jgi:hypothetical protein